MYQSRPQIKNKRITLLSLLLIVFAVMMFSLSPRVSLYLSPIMQFFAIISATVSLFILIKYVIYDYLYTFENNHLTVHRINKSKSICVCDVEIKNIIYPPMTIDEYKTYLKSHSASKVFSYIKNPGDENLRYLPIKVNGEKFTLLIEPDKDFILNLTHEIEKNTIEEDYNENF